jgi:hypothetical protein
MITTQASNPQAPTDKEERGQPSFIEFWVTNPRQCAWERGSGASSEVGTSGVEVRSMWGEGRWSGDEVE